MPRELSAHPSLAHLKSQAKDLLHAYQRGEPEAFARFRAALPAARGADDAKLARMKLALHDAQSAIAREYGFASWNELRARVERPAMTPEAIRALMKTPMPTEVAEALAAAATEAPVPVDLSTPLPLVPIRDALLTPGATAPIHIGRPSSLAAAAHAGAGGALVMFAQRDASTEAPREDDLHPTGCAVRLIAVIPNDEQGAWIVVRAAHWVRLTTIERREPFLLARVSEFTVDEGEAVTGLHQRLRERVEPLVAQLPNAEQLRKMVSAMSPLELADATIANLSCSVGDKARYAAEPDLATRLELVLTLLEQP